MKRKRILVMALLCLILLLGVLTPYKKVQAEEQSFQQKSVEQIYEEAIEELITTKKAVGVTATFVRDGKVTLQKGYGYSDKEQNLAVDPSVSGFRIGSVSKTFVAIAALIAEEDGLLDMNADITDYLEDDFPELKYPVTMEQLLTHTAGFEDLITGIAVKDKTELEPLSRVLRKYRPEQIMKPGEIISYSNYGIALAAYVIEKATGIDFAEYCEDNIFIPLGMSQTSFVYDKNNLVYSKAFLPSGEEAFEPYINIYPEGSVITTAKDMSKYIQWLLEDQEIILRNVSKDQLFARHFAMTEVQNGIGYTWNIKSRNDKMYYEKKGETVHFYSRIVLYPSCNSGFFFSANTYVPEEILNDVIDKVTERLLGKLKKCNEKLGASVKMEGTYINLRSNFTTAEKFISYLIPEKMIRISGSLSRGYQLNGKEMKHIGNDVYDTPIGTVMLIEKDGKTLLTTNLAQTYMKLNVLQSPVMIAAILLLFGLSSLLCSIYLLINLIRRRDRPLLPAILCLLQFLGLFVLCIILIIGMSNYSILSYEIPINICTWSILIMSVLHIGYLLFTCIRSNRVKYIKLLCFHNAISMVFCLLMVSLNLL